MTIAWRGADFTRSAPLTDIEAAWRRHGAALAATLVGLFALFFDDVATLAHIWWTSTTFGHCLFILPVFGWLVWQRRAELLQVRPVAWWPGLALVAAGGFGWLLGSAASVDLARQLGLLLMAQGAVAGILGPNVFRALLFPLAYLTFLVPFGEEMQGPLQTITTAITMPLLHLFGIPAQVDGVLITIPNGYFEVAEACSGAKFVIAMLAYGTLVAHVCYVGWRRRVAFMAMALTVPILANGLRAFGTIYAAHLTSVEAATGFDHILYGWVFFGVVMAAVLAIGWRWFDRAPDDPVIDPTTFQELPRYTVALPKAAGATLGIALAFLGWGMLIDSRADAAPRDFAPPHVRGWTPVPLSNTAAWIPNFPTADRFAIQRYVDARGTAVDLAVAVYTGQREGKEMVAFGQGAIRENDSWVRIENLPALDSGAALRMTAPGIDRKPVERQVVTWYWVGGLLTGDPRVAKLATLRAKLLGRHQAAVAVLASAEGKNARETLTRFRAAVGPIDALADRLSQGAR